MMLRSRSSFTGARRGAVDYATEVLADNPEIYLRLNETSGTTATDLSGNSWDLTYLPNSGGSWTGGTLNQTGPVTGGKAVLFNGTSGYLEMPSSFPMPINAAVRTVETWFRIITAGDRKIFDWGGATNGSGFSFGVENISGTNRLLFRHIGGNIRFGAITLEQWYHLAVVVPTGATTTNDVLVYLNGTNAAGTRNAGSDQTLGTAYTNGRIGARWDDLTVLFFHGNQAEFAIYTAALSAARILAHYDAA